MTQARRSHCGWDRAGKELLTTGWYWERECVRFILDMDHDRQFVFQRQPHTSVHFSSTKGLSEFTKQYMKMGMGYGQRNLRGFGGAGGDLVSPHYIHAYNFQTIN